MEFALTILGAVLTFVLGQVMVRFLIDPFHNYRILVGKIAYALIFYANATDDPRLKAPATGAEAQRELRSLAGELFECTYAIPWYGLFDTIGWVPSREDIATASAQLVGMSNSIDTHTGDSEARRENIRALLHIR